MVLFVVGFGLAIRLAGAIVFWWILPLPALAGHCLVGAGLQSVALALALARQPDVALLVTGIDFVGIASLTPRFGTGSMLFLMGLFQPFLVLLMTRWSLGFRILLACLPPVGFALIRFSTSMPLTTDLLTPEQLRHLATASVLAFIVLSMAITVHTLRTLERSLARTRELARARSRLIDDMGHELRTPVTTCLTASQSALLRDRTPNSYRESLRVIERQARAMGLMIQRMLDMGRAERDDVAVHQVDDLSAAVRRTADSFRDAAADRSIKLSLEMEPLEETTDAGVLHIVLGNLLSNAIRYSPDGSRVEIRLAAENGGYVLRVRDEGEGISEEDLPFIFERYWRADRARTRKGGEEGIGLGLAIARRFACLLGAEIEVDSKPGRGAVFTVRW